MKIGNGWIAPALVILPNILFLLFPPRHITEKINPRSPIRIIMSILERAGQAGVLIIPFFYRFSLSTTAEKIYLSCASTALLFYYLLWIRYFFSGRCYRLLFEPVIKVPLPMAVCPVVFFIALSAAILSLPLFVAALVFAIGHIYNSALEHRLISGKNDSDHEISSENSLKH